VLRNASNAQPVKALLENTSGHPFRIISGLEEARLVYLAASRTFPDLKDKTVVDIGGGSTEIIEGTGDKAGKLISLPLGAIRLTERFIRHFPTPQAELSGLQAYILEKQQEALKDFDRTGHRHVIGVAGTFTTAGAMEMKLTDYDPDKITGFTFKKAWAQAWLDRLGKLSIDQQKQIPGLHPERAGFVVAGMALILSLYDFFGIEEIIICDAGLRYGVLYDWIRS
jgi:exopolyphosphatase/guanosine-5'-triphosphate,3'-diphosphate pyrophosphatase